jgi:hypothetical protein
MALNLHVNTTADGNGTALRTTDGNGGEVATVVCWGGFGTGTLTLQMSPDNGTTFIDFSPTVTFTAASAKAQVIPQGVVVRGVLTGATGPTLFCSIFGAD